MILCISVLSVVISPVLSVVILISNFADLIHLPFLIERDMCIPMFIAALFTIARTCKQPRCPSADK